MATVGITADTCIVLASLFVAARLQYGVTTFSDLLSGHFRLLVFTLVVFIGFFTSLGVYRTISYSSFERQTFQAAKGFVYGAVIILSALFLFKNFFYTREFLLLFFCLVPIFYALTWAALRLAVRALQKQGLGRWNTLAIGAEPYLDQVLRRIEDHPELGYDVVTSVKTPQGKNGDTLLHIEPSAVEMIVNEKQVGLIVLSSSHLNGSFDPLESICKSKRIPMRVVSAESDYLFSMVHLHDIAGIPLFVPERERIDSMKRLTKRAFDVVVASLCLIALSPVFLLVAFATKLESRGPVFFKQKRSLTDRHEPFEFYKFRSMYHEADEKKESLFHRNESNGALFKIKNDPRLTKVGMIIRRFSIDELPQLVNVLKGDMSLVGPRPLPIADFKWLEEEDHMGGYYRHRAKTKPGMTGLWQISGRSNLGFREMVLLDLYYIENQSLLFDLEILAQTIPVVLFGKGAY